MFANVKGLLLIIIFVFKTLVFSSKTQEKLLKKIPKTEEFSQNSRKKLFFRHVNYPTLTKLGQKKKAPTSIKSNNVNKKRVALSNWA